MASAYRNFEQNFVFSKKSVEEIYKEIHPPRADQISKKLPSKRKMLQEVQSSYVYLDVLDEALSQKKSKRRDANHELQADSELDVEKERLYIYLGDEMGYIKIWDFTAIAKAHNIEK